MKKVNLVIIALVLIFLLPSCTIQNNNVETNAPTPTPSVSDAPKADISEYFPLAVGNTWVYEGYGNEYAQYTETVVYNEGNKYQTKADNGGTVAANILQVEADRIVNVYREMEVYDDKKVINQPSNINIILLKLPLEAGNTWISEENKYEIIKTNETVVVPYGELTDCIVVKITYKDGNEGYAYYKKGIGLVQSDYVISENEVISSKLKEFTIKK